MKNNFWHPPVWKWVVLFSLLLVSLVLWRKPHSNPASIKPELLTTQYPVPDWDGSVPTVVISWRESSRGQFTFSGAVTTPKPSVRHDTPVNQFEVNLSRGLFVLRQTDLFIADSLPLSLTRTYNAWDATVNAFGQGANHPYDICPTGTRYPYTYMRLMLEDGQAIHFERISKGTGYADAIYEHHATASEFYGAQISWNGNGWDLHLPNGSIYVFPEAYNTKSLAQGAAWAIRDGQGHEIELRRDDARNLIELRSPSGHWIRFGHDGLNRIIEAIDDAGNVRKYSYLADGHLGTISNASRVLYHFVYDSFLNSPGFPTELMSAIMDGSGRYILQNKYVNGQVVEQRLADGSVYRYKYVVDSNNNVVSTQVTLPDSRERQFNFREGRLVSSR